MSDCPDQFSVLHDRTAAHTLHDASRSFQQLFVRHLYNVVFVLLVSFVYFDDADGIFLRRNAVNCGKNTRLTRLGVFARCA